MRVKPPPLLAIFRSQVQGELLAQVLLSDLYPPDRAAAETMIAPRGDSIARIETKG